jgi:hypothetical protein
VTVDPAAPLVERPGIPYLLDTTLHRGSTTRSFPVKPVFEYLPLAEGRALLLDEFHGYEWDRLQLLDANGATVLSSTAQPMHFLWAVADGAGRRFVVMDSPDGGRSAAVLTLHDSAGTVQLKRTGVPDWLRLVGFVGDRVFLGSAAEKGGTYAWDVGNNTLSPYAAWTVGSVNEPSGRGAFTGPGEWAQPRCTLVADVRGPSPVPVSTTCGLFTLIEFSPDGRYLLGSLVEPEDPPFISPPRVIDAQTGRPVLVFDEPTPMVVRAAFLDDGSVGSRSCWARAPRGRPPSSAAPWTGTARAWPRPSPPSCPTKAHAPATTSRATDAETRTLPSGPFRREQLLAHRPRR